jgi:hypothetical protein
MKTLSTFNNCTRKAEVCYNSGTYLAKFYIDNKEVQWLNFNVQREAETVCENFILSASDDDLVVEQVLLNG